jgi:hypothetical protein
VKLLGRAAVGLVLLVILAEVLLRLGPVAALADRTFPRVSPVERLIKEQERSADPRYVPDPELGNRYAPNQRDSVRTHDFTYLIETDSAGFPNREPWPARPDAVVLGNSLVIGPGVGIDGQFSSVLSRELGGMDVVNLGLAGGSPRHQLRLYRRYVKARRPRMVVATLWVASDINNALQFDGWLADGRPGDFYRYRTSNAAADADDHPAVRGRQSLKRYSRLAELAANARAALRRSGKYAEETRFPTGETIYLSGRTQDRLAQGMTRPGAPGLTRAILEPLVQLRAEAESAGGRFVVGLIPSKEELYASARFPRVRRTIEEVRSALDSAGVPWVDLYQPVARDSTGPSPFFPRDIHLNRHGNELVGKALARWARDSQPMADAAP